MICKTGNVIVSYQLCSTDMITFVAENLIAFVVTNNLCIINGFMFRFRFYCSASYNDRIQFALLTDKNFIWDRRVKKIL
jgi:hypothetical protein